MSDPAPGPWSRAGALALAAASGHPVLDLSLGIPPDSPPALAMAGPEPSDLTNYPATAGSPRFRAAGRDYLARRFGVAVPVDAVAPCVGAKECVATLPALLRHRTTGHRDTVLVPALSYPPYRAGAEFAGLRVWRVPTDEQGRMDVAALPTEVAERAVCLFVTSPGNPTGLSEPLPVIAEWGRRHDVPVVSDEAYAELCWAGPPRTVLATGIAGVLAVHSLSKRSHVPGLRVGLLAGDPELVRTVVGWRREVGLISPGPAQRVAADLLADDAHADVQRERHQHRVHGLVTLLRDIGVECRPPEGGMFVWARAPEGSGRQWADRLAAEYAIVTTPGDVYGPTGADHVRLAAVVDPALLRERLAPVRSRFPADQEKSRR
ncbi:pyridoxal phosphate-dependent aminotransferase [Plantactinospora endophytica]|uniref:Aminotransferase n=1 Tax=Plantactinospora endophytica TaxID=673535 RepID=A0ABQ4DZM0_9ACTN|nr:pyridoxal phosphate-dependent aminotransferase [Plantactinospora endophytica]GIG87881.1 aminotransferase [Plantactinospora endophytica]